MVLRIAMAQAANGGKGEAQLTPFTDGEAMKAFMTRLTIQRNAYIEAQKAKGG